MKENSEQLPDEQPERVYAELFEKLRESLFPYDKKRSARMRTRRKNVPKHIFLPQIIEIILRQGTANGLRVLRKQYGQIAV